MNALLHNAGAANLLNIYRGNGYELRFVGGCIRDVLLGQPAKDIDFATDALPEQSIEFLNREKIRYIPTGIDHGTLTALHNDQVFEITTLRRDIKTDGRRAQVEFGGSWEEDAARRDFTVNALSMDHNGRIYDYFDGQTDLKNKNLRFIGNPEQRIQEDYLRILRYFRFLSVLEWQAKDRASLQACTKYKDQLSTLSRERIQNEVYKTLLGGGCLNAVSLLSDHNILSRPLNIQGLATLIANEKKYHATSAFRRLLSLTGAEKESDLNHLIVLTNDDKKRLKNLDDLKQKNWALSKKLYYFGKEAVLDEALLQNRIADIPSIQTWQNPVFPIKADNIMELTGGPGPLLGKVLRQAEEHWVDQDFKPGKQDLIGYIRKIV